MTLVTMLVVVVVPTLVVVVVVVSFYRSAGSEHLTAFAMHQILRFKKINFKSTAAK